MDIGVEGSNRLLGLCTQQFSLLPLPDALQSPTPEEMERNMYH